LLSATLRIGACTCSCSCCDGRCLNIRGSPENSCILLLQLLHENLALAVDVVREHHNTSPILVILGGFLSFIRSDFLPVHQQNQCVCSSSKSDSQECSLCGASHIESFFFDAVSGLIYCPCCHERRSGQRVSMRICDILAAFSLQMLRGEIGVHAEHCKALIQVFEMVYPVGQFSLSKAAVVCISNLLERWSSQPPQSHQRFCTIKIPRWAAHALFPEYSCTLMLHCDDVFAAPCAAALGWWTDDNDTRRPVTECVNSCFSIQSGRMKIEDRLPFGPAFSNVCIGLLSMMQINGSVSEAHAVATLLRQGVSIESIGCCVMHMINFSVLVVYEGRFWMSQPRGQKVFNESIVGQLVEVPKVCKSAIFIQFDDLAVAPLPQSTSFQTAVAVSQSTAEQALVDGVQVVLEHPSAICSDLLRLGAALRSNHGSFPRSLRDLISERAEVKVESLSAVHDCTSLCPLCNEETIGERNACGHGLCPNCWTDFVSATIRNSSTPEVRKGNDDDGGSLVLDVKCPADVDGKCRCSVQFSVLRKALPNGVENLVRTVMRSLSRTFLSGAAAISQCVCGALACSTLIDSEFECMCGHVQCIGDMKRGSSRTGFIPHPFLSSDDLQLWQQMNTAGSEQRTMIMRYKNCPKCGTMTTKCGCQGAVVCAGMDKCPNEACDHMKCSKCGTDWCWICRRIGSTETRCSRPQSERKDTKELLLRIGPEVLALEKSLNEMYPKSLFDDLQLENRTAGVISSKLKRCVLSISGVPVTSVETCKHVLKILDNQCAVIETADLAVSDLPSGWIEMERDGRKFFFNSESQVRQWRCPCPVVPPAQRKVEVVHAPGYLSGTNTLSIIFAVGFIYTITQATFALICVWRMNLFGCAWTKLFP
jgi:hypothetical protein